MNTSPCLTVADLAAFAGLTPALLAQHGFCNAVNSVEVAYPDGSHRKITVPPDQETAVWPVSELPHLFGQVEGLGRNPSTLFLTTHELDCVVLLALDFNAVAVTSKQGISSLSVESLAGIKSVFLVSPHEASYRRKFEEAVRVHLYSFEWTGRLRSMRVPSSQSTLAALHEDAPPHFIERFKEMAKSALTVGLAPSLGQRASEVESQQMEWLWKKHIPLGKLVIVEGDPGVGKSTFLLGWLAAAVSTGRSMPDGSAGTLGGVVLLTAEEGLGDTIRPRLAAAGADLDRILLYNPFHTTEENAQIAFPEYAERLRAMIRKVGAKLVIIDPLTAFLGKGISANNDQEVRKALVSLIEIAETECATIILIRHLNKSSVQSGLYRGAGSVAISGAARIVYHVGKHPESEDPETKADDGRRVLAATKCNIGPLPPSWVFKIVPDGDGPPTMVWLGTEALSADDLVQGHGKKEAAPPAEKLEEAKAFLREHLAGGPQYLGMLHNLRTERGISESTFKRAAKELNVKSLKTDRKVVRWALPEREEIRFDHIKAEDLDPESAPVDWTGQTVQQQRGGTSSRFDAPISPAPPSFIPLDALGVEKEQGLASEG